MMKIDDLGGSPMTEIVEEKGPDVPSMSPDCC